MVTPGLAAARVASCISATTLPARRILASSPSFRLTGLASSSQLLAQGVDGPDHAPGHRVGRAGPVDLDQQAALLYQSSRGAVSSS